MTREGKLKRDYATYVQHAKIKDPNMEVFSEDKFRNALDNIKIDYKKRGVNAPSGKLLAKQVANEQFDTAHGDYVYSKRQAKGLQRYIYEMEGKKITIKDIRKDNFNDYISAEYRNAKSNGITPKEFSHYIGVSFFGSPE